MIGQTVCAEETIGTEAQKRLNIVIYNNDRALVKDIRRVPLTDGKNEVAFSGISAQIIPSSVVLNGSGITFLENNFNFDILSYQSLLEKSLGETVTLQYMNPKTGITETNTGTLLAINGGHPVLKIGDKVDASYPGRVLFDKIPQNLRAKPTLVMTVAADKAAPQDLTLNYMTTGLSWDANYVAQIGSDNNSMTLDGWVSLSNRSGSAYQNAHLQVVAGDLHVERPYRMMVQKAEMNFADTLDAMPAPMMSEESIADYHLYTLPRTTDILNNQTKQVSLLSAQNVGVRKIYIYNNMLQPTEEVKNVKPEVRIEFENTKENHLGIALPRGIVRLYQADRQGNLIFIGEDRINHLGNLEKATLNIGTAFDISADAKMTRAKEGWRAITPTQEKAYLDRSFEIVFKNGTKAPVSIDVKENFGNNWMILAENMTSTKPTAGQAKWTVPVPAEGTAKLTYTVRIEDGRTRRIK